jgi:RNA-directed DNA polymerase
MQSNANGTSGQTDWRVVNWKHATKTVRNLRERIFRAEQEGDHRKVRNLQKLMLRSRSNVLVSVRRVTQINAGKKTPGVDKVTVKTPEARSTLVDEIATGILWKASPTRRLYIPKANGKQRPLGIPTIKDRAMQAMVKNALEPEWEAQFEGVSYGFRPGRACHDAIESIFVTLTKGKKQWILDADIEGAFDNIGHDPLLKQLDHFPAQQRVREWLKAGYMDDGGFHDTEKGTPQGGVISPLLANIALHGMEKGLQIKREPGSGYLRSHRAFTRYADDFVVMCESEEDAYKAKAELNIWLSARGLKLSEEKTRVVHVDDGFDFLGFNIRRYPVTSKATDKKKQYTPGHKLLIKPSKESVKKFRANIKETMMLLKGAPVAVVITRLNQIITGWANYFRSQVSKLTFGKLDHYIFQRESRWLHFRHHNKGWEWKKQRYFGKFAPKHNDIWVFGDKETGKYVKRLMWTKVVRHTQVKGTASPDDGTLTEYWRKRKAKLLNLTGTFATLAKAQQYQCPGCTDHLNNGEELHLHHLIRDHTDVRRNKLQYQQLLHYYCHQKMHSKGAENPVEALSS